MSRRTCVTENLIGFLLEISRYDYQKMRALARKRTANIFGSFLTGQNLEDFLVDIKELLDKHIKLSLDTSNLTERSMGLALVTGIKSGLLCALSCCLSTTSENTQGISAKADKVIEDAVLSAYLPSDDDETPNNVRTEKKKRRVVWKDLESHSTVPFAQVVPAVGGDPSGQTTRSAIETADLIGGVNIPQIVIQQPDEEPGPAAFEGEHLDGSTELEDFSSALPPVDGTSMLTPEAFGTSEHAIQLESEQQSPAPPLDDGREAPSFQLEPLSGSDQSTRPKRKKKQQPVKDICTELSAKTMEQWVRQSKKTTRPIEQQRAPIVKYLFRWLSAKQLLEVNIRKRRGKELQDFLKKTAKLPRAPKPPVDFLAGAPASTEILHGFMVPKVSPPEISPAGSCAAGISHQRDISGLTEQEMYISVAKSVEVETFSEPEPTNITQMDGPEDLEHGSVAGPSFAEEAEGDEFSFGNQDEEASLTEEKKSHEQQMLDAYALVASMATNVHTQGGQELRFATFRKASEGMSGRELIVFVLSIIALDEAGKLYVTQRPAVTGEIFLFPRGQATMQADKPKP